MTLHTKARPGAAYETILEKAGELRALCNLKLERWRTGGNSLAVWNLHHEIRELILVLEELVKTPRLVEYAAVQMGAGDVFLSEVMAVAAKAREAMAVIREHLPEQPGRWSEDGNTIEAPTLKAEPMNEIKTALHRLIDEIDD